MPIPTKPPPLLPCHEPSCGSVGIDRTKFEELFEYFYVENAWYASLRRGAHFVRFVHSDFMHAVYKEPAQNKPRTVWQPDRAERLLWIGFTLENPTVILKVRSSRYLFFCRMSDPITPWYLVVTDWNGGPEMQFVTAYGMDHEGYRRQSKQGMKLV